MGRVDDRLSESAEGGRGCGGIGFLWKKGVAAALIGGIESDRIGGIRFAVGKGEGSIMSVIGVYMPCLDQGIDVYREHLVILEH